MSNKLDLSKELIGRRALVTGGTRGIGAAIAQRLLDAGAKVVVTARARNDDIPRDDLRRPATSPRGKESRRSPTKTLAALGGLDILVNNAGGASAFMGGSRTIPDKEWHDIFALNLFAAIRLTNAVFPELRESKAAAVVNISSAAATMPFGAFAHYGAAKAALEYYSRALALDLAPSGIRVNVVSPGVIQRRAPPSLREERRRDLPPMFRSRISRWVASGPEDMAEVVALLASDRGKFMTGANFLVDGGMTAR